MDPAPVLDADTAPGLESRGLGMLRSMRPAPPFDTPEVFAMTMNWLIVPMLAVVGLSAFVWVQEREALEDQVHELVREAQELARAGRFAEARAMERKAIEAAETLEQAVTREPEEEQEQHRRRLRIRQLQEALELLAREEAELSESDGDRRLLERLRAEAEQVEEMLRDLMREEKAEDDEDDEEEGEEREERRLDERIAHLRAAAEHLSAAGMPELAEEVIHRAEELHEERARRHTHGEGEIEEMLHEVMEQLHDLRREVGNLREQVQDLRDRE